MVFNGPEARLIRCVEDSKYTLILAEFVVEEMRRIVRMKLPTYLPVFETFVQDVPHIKAPYPSLESVKRASRIIRDPKDAPVLATALEVKADHLVTGDKDFFTPEVISRIQVVSARELLERS